MAIPLNETFSQFQPGGVPQSGDIVVGLRNGVNTKFLLGAVANAAAIQTGAYNTANDSGIVNAYIGVYSPEVTVYTPGMTFEINALISSNTGAATFNAGAGAIPILTPNLSALVGGEMLMHNTYLLMYNQFLNSWILLNSSLDNAGSVSPTQIQQNAFSSANDTGSANAYVGVYSPVIATYAGSPILLLNSLTASNTGAVTFNAGGGVLPVVTPDFNALTGGEMKIHETYYLLYNQNIPGWILLNSSLDVTPTSSQMQKFNIATDSGAVNAYLAVFSPTIASYAAYNGVTFSITGLTATNTGAATLNGISILTPSFSALIGGEMVVGQTYYLMYNAASSAFILMNSSLEIGQIISSVVDSASRLSCSNSVARDITSIVLPPGKWIAWGNFYLVVSLGATSLSGWISETSATFPDAAFVTNQNGTGLVSSGWPVPQLPFTVTVPTTIYLSCEAVFSSGTVGACGGLYAMRIQ